MHIPERRIVSSASNLSLNLEMPLDAVDVWRASLQVSDGELSWLATLLSADEQKRAGRFRFDRHRREFIVARGRLRQLLAAYTGCAPDQLEFHSGPYGKPYSAKAPEFNLSHSGEVTLFAFSTRRRVGIDVELIPDHAVEVEAMKDLLPTDELAAVAAMSGAVRNKALLECWTRTEAFLKGIGLGVAAATEHLGAELRNERRLFRVSQLNVSPRYAAAVAAEGCDWHIRSFVIPANCALGVCFQKHALLS